MKRKNLSPSVRDYHSLHWLLYVYLQQGRYRKAEELLSLMKKTMAETTYENKLRPGYYENNYANMAAAFVVETERWDLANTLFPANESTTASGDAMGSHSHSAALTDATLRTSDRGQRLPIMIRGFAAGSKGTLGPGGLSNSPSINELEVFALGASVKGEHDSAATLMKRAVELEEKQGPPSGPPGLIKPSHELFGELLLRADKPAEAAEQFRLSLLRQPNRARSLLGAARAAAKTGDRATATAIYQKFLAQWQQADAELPELIEAREFLKQ
jgi:tetratricopeptide (TPR) repeat protein